MGFSLLRGHFSSSSPPSFILKRSISIFNYDDRILHCCYYPHHGGHIPTIVKRRRNFSSVKTTSYQPILSVRRPIQKFNNNKYIALRTLSSLFSSSNKNNNEITESTAEHQEENDYYGKNHNFNEKSNNNKKTWKRLQPLISLTSKDSRVVADIGCDHGLLSIALAKEEVPSRRKVIGIDASLSALQQGAFKQQRRQQEEINNSNIDVTFLQGNGLEPLLLSKNNKNNNNNENNNNMVVVDTICVAGMGVNTMIGNIFQNLHPNNGDDDLDRLKCNQLVLQPTNTRPRNLIKLYRHILSTTKWKVDKEHMIYLSKRWYLTTSFIRRTDDDSSTTKTLNDDDNELIILPGETLRYKEKNSLTCNNEGQEENQKQQDLLYQQYVQHHIRWIQQDRELKKRIRRRQHQREEEEEQIMDDDSSLDEIWLKVILERSQHQKTTTAQ